jgi:NAD(P)-dependent dehydrogenase (short-subunit alcohol dehydrogenase family)
VIRFEGKVVVITGAGGGIGRAHALAFGKAGAQVVVNDVGGEAAERVANELRAAGATAISNSDSVTSREGADRLLWATLSKFGRVDVLINNAGILRDRSFLQLSDEEWQSVIQVHLNGTFLCSQVFARQLRLQGQGGRILNTTSLAGLLGNFGQANYSAAKAGIYGLTRTMAIELEKARVTVNALAPIALTQMTEKLPAFQGITPAELGPDHVAPVALFLASDQAAHLTGQIVGVEGRRVFLYRMERGEGAEAKESWTPDSIAEAWGQISAG